MQLLADAALRAQAYLDALATRAVAPAPEAVARLAALDVPLPERAGAPADVLAELDELAPATMAMAGPRFFGFVIGGCAPGASRRTGSRAPGTRTPGFTSRPRHRSSRRSRSRWLLDVLRLPPQCGGAFVTGRTVAHLSALAAARHALLAKVGWNVEADGLFGAPPITVVSATKRTRRSSRRSASSGSAATAS